MRTSLVFWSVIVVLGLLMTPLWGGGQQQEGQTVSEGKPTRVVMLQDTGLDSDFLPEVFAQIEQYYPIKVELVEASTNELWAKIFAMIAAGDQLDVVQAGPMDAYLPVLADEGLIMPLDDFPRAKEHIDMLLPMARYGYTYKGKLYGLPEEIFVELLMYNKPMWAEVQQELGVSSPPTDWDGMEDLGKKVKNAGICEYPYIWAMGTGVSHLMLQFFAFAHSMGAKVFDDDWNLMLDEGQPARAAFEWWVDSINKWQISEPASTEMRHFPAAREFAKGNNLFHMAQLLNYSLVALREEHPLKGEDMGLFPMPGKGAVSWAQCYSITSFTKNPDAAWILLVAICGKEEKLGWLSQREYATRMGYGIGYEPIMEDPEVTNFLRGWMGQESMEVYFDAHRTATNLREVAPAMAATWFPEWQMKAQAEMQNALNGQITTDAAVKRMNELVEEFKAGN